MAQDRVNGYLNSGHADLINGKNRVEKKNINAAMGEFHMPPFELQQPLLTVSIKDSPKTRSAT